MSINKKNNNNQTEWSDNKWEQEQIFTGQGKDYGIAYKFRKSSVKLKRSKNYIVIALVVVVSIVAVYFSSSLIVTSVSNLGNSSGVVTAPAIDYFAVQSGEYSTIEEATLQSQRVREIGGAGYVYKKDLTYKVLVSVYEKQEDAESVVSKISDTLPRAEVVTLKSPEIVMDYNLNEQDSKCLSDALNVFHSIFSKLYSISTSFDLDETTFAMAQLSVLELLNEFEQIYVPYSSVFGNTRDVRIASLTYKLSVLQDELDKLADPMALQENFSINIKYSIISVCLARAYI